MGRALEHGLDGNAPLRFNYARVLEALGRSEEAAVQMEAFGAPTSRRAAPVTPRGYSQVNAWLSATGWNASPSGLVMTCRRWVTGSATSSSTSTSCEPVA